MRRVSTTVPAPADLGIDVVGVPEGSDVTLELRLESVLDGVLVTGTARTRVAGECARCLDPLERELEADFQELYAYPDESAGRRAAPRDDESDLLELDGVLLDLEPVLRDAVVLALPLKPLCREDCPGLCQQCGARLADDPEHGHEAVDPRWAALQGLAIDDSTTPNGTTPNGTTPKIDNADPDVQES